MNHGKRVYEAAKRNKVALLNAVALRAVIDDAADGLVEWQDEQGRTALNIAAENKNWNCVEWLLVMGANVNQRSRGNGVLGNTSLHEAMLAQNCPLQLLEAMLEAGAKMMIESASGQTTWDLARSQARQRPHILNLFCRYLSNDAVFDDLVYVTEKRMQRPLAHGSMRHVMILHRYATQGHIRRVVLIFAAHNPSHVIDHWIDTIDLDPPEMRYAALSFDITFSSQPLLRAETKVERIGFRFGLNEEGRSESMEHFLGALQIEVPEPPEQLPQPSNPPPHGEHDLNALVSQLNGPCITAALRLRVERERFLGAFCEESSDQGPEPSTSTGAKQRSKVCTICYEHPINTGFVHGTSVHCCACSACAEAITKVKNATCPVCREEIQTVVTNFFI